MATSDYIRKFKAKNDCQLQHNKKSLSIKKGETYDKVEKFWKPYLKGFNVI